MSWLVFVMPETSFASFVNAMNAKNVAYKFLWMMLLQNARVAKTNDVFASQENMRTEIIPCAHYLSQEEKIMRIRELFDNPGFEINCDYRIYECHDGKTWHESPIISDSVYDGARPRAELAERETLYITIDHGDLVVEVR